MNDVLKGDRGVPRLLFIARDLADNSTGRVFALWSLARRLGWDTTVVASRGDVLWEPLRKTEFEENCRLITEEGSTGYDRLVILAREADLIVAAKPFEETLGLGLRLSRKTGTAVLLDVDDPDIEVRLPLHSPLKLILRLVKGPNAVLKAARMKKLAKAVPTIVSNPNLQAIYGGSIVGHVRTDTGVGKSFAGTSPSVVFVGTNRRHKGVRVLRKAVDRLAADGFTITLTDTAPVDAKPWESWVGRTSLERGLKIVRNADIVVIPSLNGHTTSTFQLPAKLMDAMIAGRALIVSDFPPLRWAAGAGALVIKPGSIDSLTTALRALADPERRALLGAQARSRALELFTVDAALPIFKAACEAAIRESSRPGSKLF